MSPLRAVGLLALAALALVPVLPLGEAQEYIWHVIIQIFLWSFVGQAWSLMGRFGLVSLGHGAFLGVGAYAAVLFWNFYGMTPWLGAVLAVGITVVLALVVAYPCSRFQVVGHYFGLVTLAVGEVVRLLIVAERDWTGGSLGLTLKTGGTASDWWTLQFADKRVFYYVGLAAWRRHSTVARASACPAFGSTTSPRSVSATEPIAGMTYWLATGAVVVAPPAVT